MDTVLAVLLVAMALANCVLCIALASVLRARSRAVCKPIVKVNPKADSRGDGPRPSFAESARLIDCGHRSLAKSYGLSSRETDVFILLIRGKSYAAVADELCVCIATVKSHVNKIYGKTGVHSRDELIDLVECGLRQEDRDPAGSSAVA